MAQRACLASAQLAGTQADRDLEIPIAWSVRGENDHLQPISACLALMRPTFYVMIATDSGGAKVPFQGRSGLVFDGEMRSEFDLFDPFNLPRHALQVADCRLQDRVAPLFPLGVV
jgi:hypothetical protein